MSDRGGWFYHVNEIPGVISTVEDRDGALDDVRAVVSQLLDVDASSFTVEIEAG